jgi:hypothetical protein
MIVDTPTRVLLETLKVNMHADLRDELQKIGVPTLIVHGDQDASAPIDLTGRQTAALIADATLVVYPGAGHGLYASDHDTLNADLLAFIRAAALSEHSQSGRSQQNGVRRRGCKRLRIPMAPGRRWPHAGHAAGSDDAPRPRSPAALA